MQSTRRSTLKKSILNFGNEKDDFINIRGNRRDNKKALNLNYTMSSSKSLMVTDKEEMELRMKTQKLKEKKEKKEYNRKRNTEKRVENIVRLQSRRVKEINKLCYVKVFDEYEEHEGTYIWKHAGCNEKCFKENCLTWAMEELMQGR